jgi:hypothetical protein
MAGERIIDEATGTVKRDIGDAFFKSKSSDLLNFERFVYQILLITYLKYDILAHISALKYHILSGITITYLYLLPTTTTTTTTTI